MSARSRGRPRHFSFFGGAQGHAQNGHFLSVFGGALCSFVLNRWCTKQFCMDLINCHLDGTQYDVVSSRQSICIVLV